MRPLKLRDADRPPTRARPMPLNYARRLTGRERTKEANSRLGVVLAFVAGAINAGGFLAVHQYTSHMTGIVSLMADSLATGSYGPALAGFGALLSFVFGAMTSAVLVNYARRRQLTSEYAIPLLLEAALLLCFGLAGATLQRFEGLFVPATVMLLCFIMGLQNAVISKISRSEIRTTHITGTVTDIGIELGKLVYWNRSHRDGHKVLADRSRLTVLTLLALGFFLGAVAGALGFNHAGYLSTVPLALVLIALACVPALDDLVRFARTRLPQ
jgi:uncharacterized membrane protein YoaK (UPF0700 family)